MNNNKVTISSSHYLNSKDIDNSSTASLLKPFAVTKGSSTSDIYSKEHKSSTIMITGFNDFKEGLEEIQESIVENWNIYRQNDIICFYRLSHHDENFNITYKLLIDKFLKVKLFCGDREASDQELNWVLQESLLKSWSQLERILDHYQQQPEIVYKSVPLSVCLQQSFDAMNQIETDEFQVQIESIKSQLVSLANQVKVLEEAKEAMNSQDDASDQKQNLNESCDETVEEFLDQEETEPTVDAQTCLNESFISESYPDEYEEMIEYENPNTCEKCSITLLSETGLRAHQKQCNATFVKSCKKTNLPEPEPVPKNDVNICETCGKYFKSLKGLKDHLKLHNQKLRQKCPQCDLVMFTYALMRHIRAVHNKIKPYKCQYCNRAFSASSVKDSHEATHRKNQDLQKYMIQVEGSPRYSCPRCPVHYETSTLLKKHLEKNCRAPKKKRVYRYPCPCADCSRNFSTKIQAAQHMFTVHQIAIEDVEKFCFECNSQVEDYVNHIRIHSCNFSCSFCGSKFLTQEKVLKHEESKHSKETDEDRPFKCSEGECDARFKNLNHLRSHQQAFHIQQNKEFQCPECDKKFGLKAHLTVHIRQHYVTFPCNYLNCARVFKKLNNLKGHMEREHGIVEIYLCNYEGCADRFKILNELKHHRESEHGVSFNTHKYFDSN